MINQSSLQKLIRLCNSLLTEFITEIEERSKFPAITTMIKTQLKSTNLQSLGFNPEILSLFFYPKTITEIDLYSSHSLGIKCFFMSEGTFFPIHDHPNSVVITNVLFGEIKHLSLNKTEDPNLMVKAVKGTGRQGKTILTTLKHRNAHSILAETNTIIIDIFMRNVLDNGDYFKVVKKTGNKFFVDVDNHVHFLTRSFKAVDFSCSHDHN